jgi:indole-3-glycerol phosphate synthase
VSDILEQIVARTRARLRETRSVAARPSATPFAFSKALAAQSPAIIAEIKSASPSAGSIIANPDVEAIAREYAAGGAAAISIVTEPEFFRGSTSWIRRASDATGLPVIMKDFVIEPQQIEEGVACGASAMLLLASLLDGTAIRRFIGRLDAYGVDALVEVHNEHELQRAIEGGARIIGVNNRNLRDFHVDLATAELLAPQIPEGTLRVAESGIKSHADVTRLQAAGFTAFLVGESLLRQNDRAAAVRALLSK